MSVSVTMPELGESVTEATVTRWLKDVGDTVAVDEPLLEVSTDKVDTEIPSPVAGTVLELLVGEDEVVEVGGLLAHVGEAGESCAVTTEPVTDRKPAPAAAPAESTAVQRARAEPAPAAPVAPNPVVEQAAEPAPREEPRRAGRSTSAEMAGTQVPMSRLRQIIAQRMTESLTLSAQLTTVQEVDVTRVARLRVAAKDDFTRREGIKLTFLPFIAKAVVETLATFPALNASISEDGKSAIYHDAVHLAVAVDTPRGLLIPVIRNAQELGVVGLARRIADVAERTRTNTITADELSGGTFTITNIGSVGALFDTPIINQPQVAILATGAVYRTPAVITGPDGEDQIAVRSRCYLPMTYDHRLVDGADAGRFVSAVRARLEEGAFGEELGM
ncbi:2-oxo acid dehydrogenase subunit E2 [Pseudonocardia abyssalis]|uniref:Dihydrolipoamide acetyltransferase component of pyruvate dehydrogenase complex n=1 Tax=Pseudonocardia abyssalis TaxID=2792008 RepID=A0ABS6V1W3_9PSEU|nr:2-oxo acid dehydrogenase subunit E2 [Pseudonocardia abyssalis]MBW0114192.1 2-oxo acid dehydrogenase subunit E2 [Pseudonocardia abyssalis]MBW0138503.1 2-oxo acid dehydrogenase subunit E2 [Pseudonocardia abyssalis]